MARDKARQKTAEIVAGARLAELRESFKIRREEIVDISQQAILQIERRKDIKLRRDRRTIRLPGAGAKGLRDRDDARAEALRLHEHQEGRNQVGDRSTSKLPSSSFTCQSDGSDSLFTWSPRPL